MAKTAKVKIEKSALGSALDHVYIASKGAAPYAGFCKFDTGWLIGYDSIIAAGARTPEHLPLAPDTELFRHAVHRAGNPIALTALPDGQLGVTGASVRAKIPCYPIDRLPNVVPANAFRSTSDSFKAVLVDGSKLALTKAETIVGSAVQIRPDTAVITNGQTIVEGWHGNKFDGAFIVPREFADACSKVKMPMTGLGWDQHTLTVWFGPDLWLRTNIYTISFPDTDIYFAQMISAMTEYRPVPEAMLQAIETLKPFREGPNLTITDYGLNTHKDGSGASFSFQHFMLYRGEFPADALTMCASHGRQIAFNSEGAYWFGPVFRGITSLRAL